MNKKVYIETLGCAKNLVDSEVILGCLSVSGYSFTNSREEAEIIIVNTCAFIEDATRESIETILLAAGQKKSGDCKHLIVCGCLPQRYRAELLKELPEVDLFIGTGEFINISAHLLKLISNSNESKILVERRSFLMDSSTPRIVSTPGCSAYIKISEGCCHRCTYCTIPGIRGPYNGRPQKSILQEAEHLCRSGIREIILIAQDTTQYKGLAKLLKQIAEIPEIKWIRLLYCHPLNLNTDIIKVLSENRKVCSYIDIPLQHISDPVLKRMGRQVTRKEIESLLKTIKSSSSHIAIRTTFMVGFPGETEKDFNALLLFAEETRFDHMGAFEYRDENGTPSSKLANKVPQKIKEHRYHKLMHLQSKVSKGKNRALIGNIFEVLVESVSTNKKYKFQGRSQYQSPEVDGVVYINEDVSIGSFVKVQITKALTYDLVGEVAQ